MKLDEAFMAWRKDRVSIEHIERQPILDHEAPFTDDFKDWRRFKSLVQAGDELWTFRSPQEEWDRFMGWQGIVLVRDGRFVDVCVTAQN
jgi:hypothetical protein